MKYHIILIQLLIFGCAHNYPDFTTNLSSRLPIEGKAETFGEYSLGCLKGAQTFVGNELGIKISQKKRGRYWGHPNLIKTISDAGEFFYKMNKSLIIGDLSMSRGGPMIKGHNSHQNGLDVDVWFKVLDRNEEFNFLESESAEMEPILKIEDDQLKMIKFFANHEEVERIFINFDFKKKLCDDNSLNKLTRLTKEEHHKLRPWWGHDDHIHVRIKCPKDDSKCQSQNPIPEGDGCNEKDLQWWYSEESILKNREISLDEIKRNYLEKIKNLPKECYFYNQADF